MSIRVQFLKVVGKCFVDVEIRLTRKTQGKFLGMDNILENLHASNVRKPASSIGRYIRMKKSNLLYLELLDDSAKIG
jgi:hypothetical protein